MLGWFSNLTCSAILPSVYEMVGSTQSDTAGASSSQITTANSTQVTNLNGVGNADYGALAQEIEDVRFAVLGERSTIKQLNGSAVAELRSQISRSVPVHRLTDFMHGQKILNILWTWMTYDWISGS